MAAISSAPPSTPLASLPIDSDAIELRVASLRLELHAQAEAHAAERAMLLNSLKQHTITAITASETETEDHTKVIDGMDALLTALQTSEARNAELAAQMTHLQGLLDDTRGLHNTEVMTLTAGKSSLQEKLAASEALRESDHTKLVEAETKIRTIKHELISSGGYRVGYYLSAASRMIMNHDPTGEYGAIAPTIAALLLDKTVKTPSET